MKKYLLGLALFIPVGSHGQVINTSLVNLNSTCPSGNPPAGSIWACRDVIGNLACKKSDGSSCLASSVIQSDPTRGPQIAGTGSTGQLYVGAQSGLNAFSTAAWWNTSLGYGTLGTCTSNLCNKNVAIGTGAMSNGASPRANTAIGLDAMAVMDKGLQNTCMGADCMIAATGGAVIGTVDSNNTCMGVHCLFTQNLGGPNSGLGFETMFNSTTAAQNTGLGYNTGWTNTTGSFNLWAGHNAGFTQTTANDVTALGVAALFNNTISDNTAVGYSSGFANTTGINLTAVGSGALFANTTGQNNTCLGFNCMHSNLVGSSNTALGSVALNSSTGSGNVAIGYNAGFSNTSGTGNIFLGTGAGFANTTLSNQLFVGAQQATGDSVTDGYFGSGAVTDSSPVSFTFHGAAGTGANVTGASLTLAPGSSTGNAPGGVTNLRGCGTGGAGSSVNSCATSVIVGLNGLTSYNGVNTVGNGASIPYFQDDQTALVATRGPITALTGTASSGGHWRLCYAEEVTTSDASGRTITITANFTSHAVARVFSGAAIAVAATTNSERSCVALNVDNSTNVTYTVTASGAFTTAQYAVDVWMVKE